MFFFFSLLFLSPFPSSIQAAEPLTAAIIFVPSADKNNNGCGINIIVQGEKHVLKIQAMRYHLGGTVNWKTSFKAAAAKKEGANLTEEPAHQVFIKTQTFGTFSITPFEADKLKETEPSNLVIEDMLTHGFGIIYSTPSVPRGAALAEALGNFNLRVNEHGFISLPKTEDSMVGTPQHEYAKFTKCRAAILNAEVGKYKKAHKDTTCLWQHEACQAPAPK